MASPNFQSFFVMGRHSVSMLIEFLVSTLLAILSGLGVGGGSLLMLWLTLFKQIPHADAKYINLVFFLPPALFSCIDQARKNHLQIMELFPASIAGSVSALIFLKISLSWDTALLKKAFGVLFLISAIRELRYFTSKKNGQAAC